MRAFLLLFAVFVTVLQAENITGTILIRKRLTKPRVTSSASIYERGPVVAGPLRNGAGNGAKDPLDAERARVVIWLEGALPTTSAAVNAEMRQEGKRFEPELLAIPAGSSVAFPNLDPIFHNVFSLSRPRSFDLGNYVRGDSRTVTFGKPGVVAINCHLHPGMAAWIVVTPNRWYTKAGPNGHYALPEVPPGEYTAVAWHKSAGFFRKTVRVAAGHDAVGENETLPRPKLKAETEPR
jgi:plastocyanin